LRHDPDVILIGEIRDPETAQIAVQASLTGHLVFSTLHTNDAPGALTRLWTWASSRISSPRRSKPCSPNASSACCAALQAGGQFADRAGVQGQARHSPDKTIYKSVGCRECRNTGFFGRHAIFEWMDTDEEIRQLILKNASTDQIRDAARRAGMRTLAEDGWRLVPPGSPRSRKF
jgi:type II secretory ATPase GspE/PulE/Tfp pilus assembly ATPase PilB-like protein